MQKQREIMSAHRRCDQVTLFTAIVYYRADGELKHASYVIVSNSMDHSKDAVHTFNGEILRHVRANPKIH